MVIAILGLIAVVSGHPAAATPLLGASPVGETPAGSVGIRLVDVPAATADDPRTREYIVDHLQPGVSIDRRVEISNTTGADLEVALYGAAATIENDAFRGLGGRAPSTLTSWMSFEDASLVVPPGETVLSNVTIAVPSDAAPNEHYGVVWAEVKGTDDGPVALVARTGIRVYLSVGGNNPPESDFSMTSITAERDGQGAPAITATVNNTGGRALDLSGTITLAAVTGTITAGPYPVTVGTTLAPGTEGAVRGVITDEIANGPWNVTLELHSGLLTKTETVEVLFPEGPGASAPVPVAAGPPVLIITAVVLGAVVIAVAGWLLIRERRKNSRPPQPSRSPVSEH